MNFTNAAALPADDVCPCLGLSVTRRVEQYTTCSGRLRRVQAWCMQPRRTRRRSTAWRSTPSTSTCWPPAPLTRRCRPPPTTTHHHHRPPPRITTHACTHARPLARSHVVLVYCGADVAFTATRPTVQPAAFRTHATRRQFRAVSTAAVVRCLCPMHRLACQGQRVYIACTEMK